jgi:hypothetical protein
MALPKYHHVLGPIIVLKHLLVLLLLLLMGERDPHLLHKLLLFEIDTLASCASVHHEQG